MAETLHRHVGAHGLQRCRPGPRPGAKDFSALSNHWKSMRLCYASGMNGDGMIRKQVGRLRDERPLVRLDRLNRGLRNLGLMQPHESRTDHVRKIVGRVR